MSKVSVNINSLMPRMTMCVRVTGVKEFGARKRLAIYCLKLAAWILNCGIEVVNGELAEE